MDFNRISKLSNLVTNDLKRKPTIILEPNPEQAFRMIGTASDINFNIDADDWTIPDDLKSYVQELAQKGYSTEEMILEIYKKICKDYTYDDNVLSYVRKNEDDTFYLTDSYGRRPDFNWKENRKKHNRRNCFEISRILAKSIKEALRNSKCSENYDVCILWDEAVTHYLVGLASNDYCISLDVDDFTQIKDLTRLKTGLTLDGINILDDPSNKFKTVLDNFNTGREKIAKDNIQKAIVNTEEYPNSGNSSLSSDDVLFLQYSVQILKESYHLDSAGIFEYMKEIIDTKIGARSRRKVWKEVENTSGIGARYTRCLIVTINDESYIIDVTKENISEIFRAFDSKELNESNVIPFSRMTRDWENDPYDGR